jgi:hypothetical protein
LLAVVGDVSNPGNPKRREKPVKNWSTKRRETSFFVLSRYRKPTLLSLASSFFLVINLNWAKPHKPRAFDSVYPLAVD